MDLAPEIERNVAAALAEDVGPADLTAPLTPADKWARAYVLCRQEAVVCGHPWFEACFYALILDLRRDLFLWLQLPWFFVLGLAAYRYFFLRV